jgi:uncharacterized Zn finger protein (UPF0148 family)
MAYGDYNKRRVSGRPPNSGRGLGVRSKEIVKKTKNASIKNQIRSIQRLLRKNISQEVKEVQEKKLADLRKLIELQDQSKLERKMALRYRKVKFFERRKIERRIRRLEKQQRAALEHTGEDLEMQAGEISHQLAQLKEDLEYVRFFPKTEKYLSLFMGGNDPDLVAKRNKLRELIKANLVAAAASGIDIEAETGSDDDGNMDISEDEFFLAGSSSDDVNADDEWTDKSTRDPGSSASGKGTSGVSSDEKKQKLKSASTLMPPPRPHGNPSTSTCNRVPARCGHSSSSSRVAGEVTLHASNKTSRRSGPSSSNSSEVLRSHPNQGGSLSSISDAQKKPRRKRRPKKKK